MTYGLIGGWRTKEFRDLMDYVQSNKISVAGFDVQRSGGAFVFLLKEISIQENLDTTLISNIEERFGGIRRKLLNRKTVFDSVQLTCNKLIDDFQQINTLLQSTSSTSLAIQIAQRTIVNRIQFIQYRLDFLKDRDWNKRWLARDSMMAANVNWLIDHVYKDEKVIIVAHNFHISRYSENEEVMGEYLKKRYKDEMYSIGVFAETGIFISSGKEKKMMPPDSASLDLKHIITKLPGTISYLNTPQQKTKGGEWFFEKIIVNDTFIDLSNSNQLNLSRHFDGLLLLKSVSIPEK